jgi:hypothetical protein
MFYSCGPQVRGQNVGWSSGHLYCSHHSSFYYPTP